MNNNPKTINTDSQPPIVPPRRSQSTTANSGITFGIIGTVFNMALTPVVFAIVMATVSGTRSDSLILIMTVGTITTAIVSIALTASSLYLSASTRSSKSWGIASLVTSILVITFYVITLALLLLLGQLDNK